MTVDSILNRGFRIAKRVQELNLIDASVVRNNPRTVYLTECVAAEAVKDIEKTFGSNTATKCEKANVLIRPFYVLLNKPWVHVEGSIRGKNISTDYHAKYGRKKIIYEIKGDEHLKVEDCLVK